MGTFVKRMKQLASTVPDEHFEGQVIVDQIYAHYQHANPEFKHPEDGKAFYLRDPLYSHADSYMKRIADELFDDGVIEAMIKNMENLSLEVYMQAPLEFGDLKASGHPMVWADGSIVYDRPPRVHRLTEAELEAKGELRQLYGRI